MSEAEQATFFGRFGKDLERLLLGRFERIEEKIDFVRFAHWRAGHIRKIDFELRFPALELSRRKDREHFRACLELQGVAHEKRSIIIGGRDDYWRAGEDEWYFGTKAFFWRERIGKIEDSWIPRSVRMGGGHVGGIRFSPRWKPVSGILAAEFDDLRFHLHLTENLIGKVSRVRFAIDDYWFLDGEIADRKFESGRPSLGWPDPLTEEEFAVAWRYLNLGGIDFDWLPKLARVDDE